MAWLGEGLSSLRGQITNVANFTKDVLSDGRDDDLSDISGLAAAQRNIRELEEACAAKDLEISNLRRRNELFEGGDGGSQDIKQAVVDHGCLEYVPTDAWAPGGAAGGSAKDFVVVPEEKEVSLMSRIDRLEAENRLMRRTCHEYEEQVADLLERQVKSASTTSEDSAQLDKFSADLLSGNSSDDDVYKLQLQAAECRVAELEGEVRRVERQLLAQLGGAEASTSAVRGDVAQARLQLAGGPQEGDEAVRARQHAANTMHKLGEKRREIESCLQKLRGEQRHLAGDISSIVQRLGDSEQQELIHGALTALELENQVLKMRNAELEMSAGNITGIDLDAGFKRNHFNGADEMTDDSPLRLAKHDSTDALLLEELSAAKQCLTLELESMAALVQRLEARSGDLQEENAALTASLEELDQQHQAVIDQLLGTKKAVQKEKDALQSEVSALKQQLEDALARSRKTDETKSVSAEASTETIDSEITVQEPTVSNEMLREEFLKTFEDESYANILKLVTFDLPKEYHNRDKYSLNCTSLVKEIVKACEESKWKKDTLERKVPELMKKVQDAERSVTEREGQVVRLERESDALKDNIEALVRQLTEDKGDTDGLAVIPENSEEIDLLEQRIAGLESRLEENRADKERLLAEVRRLNEESVSSAGRVLELQAALEQALEANTELRTVRASEDTGLEQLRSECSRLQESLNERAEQLSEVTASNGVLEKKCSDLEGALKAASDSSTRAGVQAREEMAEMKATFEKNITEWEERCEKIKCDVQKEFLEKIEKSKLEINIKLEESIRAEANAIEKCSGLETMLENQVKLVTNLENEIQNLKSTADANENECHRINALLSTKDQEIVRASETAAALELQLLAASDTRAGLEAERERLLELENCKATAEQQLDEALRGKAELEAECERLRALEGTTHEVEKWKATAEQQLEEALRGKAELEAERERLHALEGTTHEAEKWKAMAKTAERQLDEALRGKAELEDECARLFGIERKVHDQAHLEREVARLTEITDATGRQFEEALGAKALLERNLDQLKASLEDQKDLEREATEWRQANAAAEHQLQDAMATNMKLIAELTKLKGIESESAQLKGTVEVLQFKLQNTSSSNNELKSQLENAQTQVQRLVRVDLEIIEWKEKERVTQGQLNESLARSIELERENRRLEDVVNSAGVEKSDREKPHADDNVTSPDDRRSLNARGAEEQLESLRIERNKISAALEERTRENAELKSENDRLVQIVSEEKASISKLEMANNETFTQQVFQSSEASHMAKETIANLSKIIKDKDIEMEALVRKCETLVSLVEGTDALSKEVSRLGAERDELIRTVQVKHQESLQYHGEIQRLSGLLNQELGRAEQIRLRCEDKQQPAGDPESAAAQDEVIRMKTELAKELGLELRTREKEIELLKLELVELRGAGGEGNEGGRGGDLVRELQAERSRLLDGLQQETTRNKYLQNEVQEQHEKERSLLRELERLRLHLVTVEDTFTAETLATEEQTRELQARLAAAEDRIKGTTTAYTSANIRANQHVESLQGQARMMGQQRDDVQAKLAAAEDRVERHAAALANLQAVLEQFQRDKERDMASASAKLRKQLENAEARSSELGAQATSLSRQLAEAKDGLSAAARLTEQLDRKSNTIAALKEDVQRLNEQLSSAETREKSASQSSEGKVDRYLLKNLLLGYLVAPEHTKLQALRILASVLDLNHDERSRVGLEPGAQTAGWFHSLMHPAAGTATNQSLAEAFVRFLESESRPQPQLRILPSIQELPHSTTDPAGGTRSPLLLSEVQLPSFTQFPVARSSSSILKDVLKDS